MSEEPNANKIQDSIWEKIKLPVYHPKNGKVKNANQVHSNQLTRLEKVAVVITDKVGSMGFFILVAAWTVLWCGYNILASQVPALGWKAFDPFPAFVAYLLISNVIQILLMPLIMVGQNLQGRHSEIRAELDFEINKKAEEEVMVVLQHIEHNTSLIIQLMKHLDCKISDVDLRAIKAESELAEKLEATRPKGDLV